MGKCMSLRGSLKVVPSQISPPSSAPSILYINSAGIRNCCFRAYHFMFIPTYIKLCRLEIVFPDIYLPLLLQYIHKPQLSWKTAAWGEKTLKVETVKLKALTSQTLPLPSPLRSPDGCRHKSENTARGKSNSGGEDVTQPAKKKKMPVLSSLGPNLRRWQEAARGEGERRQRVTVERRACSTQTTTRHHRPTSPFFNSTMFPQNVSDAARDGREISDKSRDQGFLPEGKAVC